MLNPHFNKDGHEDIRVTAASQGKSREEGPLLLAKPQFKFLTQWNKLASKKELSRQAPITKPKMTFSINELCAGLEEVPEGQIIARGYRSC